MMLPSWGCIQRSWIVFTSPMFSKRRVESKDAFVHQFSAKRDRIGIVDRQQPDRGATDVSSAYEDRAIPRTSSINFCFMAQPRDDCNVFKDRRALDCKIPSVWPTRM